MKTVTITKKKISQKTCTVFVLSILEKTLKQYAHPLNKGYKAFWGYLKHFWIDIEC